MSSLPSTITDRRLLAARILLALALLMTVLAVFLPSGEPGEIFSFPVTEGLSLANFRAWWSWSELFASFLWEWRVPPIVHGVIVLVLAINLLLQGSSVWLVRFYHQSRPLCWIARILAFVCAGASAYVVFLDLPVSSFDSGFLVWTIAACLLLIGLFLIPHSRQLLPPS